MSINTQNCGVSELGTALPECFAELGFPKGFILTKKDWSEDVSTTIDKAYIQEQIQIGNFIPFLNSTGFEEGTPEPTNQEFQDGTKVNARSAKPEFSFTFTKSVNFQKIASSYNSFEKYNVLLAFDNDVLFTAISSDETKISGFDLGMLHSNTFNHNTGSEVGNTVIMMQLLNNKQYNNGAIWNPDYALLAETNGVLDLNIELASTAGTITAKVTSKINNIFNVLGLQAGNFRLVVDGAAEAVDTLAYDDVNDNYVVGATSSLSGGETLVLESYDNALSTNITALGDRFYRGKSNEITYSA